MGPRPDPASFTDLESAAAWPFLGITFGLSWGILALWLAAEPTMTALFGPLSGTHPLFLLAVYAPAIAAVFLVLRRGGARGLRRFLSRLFLWRCHWGWYFVLLVGLPAAFYGGAWVKGAPLAEPFELGTGALLSLVVIRTLTGPIEEFGWRGVLQPLLQRRMAPLWAGLVVGLIWSMWHLPAFFLSGTPQSAWGFLPFLAGSTAASVILSGMFNAGRGSLLIPILFHAQLNSPLWPDGQPFDTLFFVALAALVVALNWRTMTGRDKGVTAVAG
ncbi:MAG: CPBP family intramembrane glutamic endopeptidase [Rhodovulum sp.]